MSVYFACILAVGEVSSYPEKFMQSTTVRTASSVIPPAVSRSSSRICHASVAAV